jgi:hypothetical protein
MPRQPRRFRDPLAEAYSAVKQLADSPFEAIAQRLISALDLASQAHARAEVTAEQLAGLSKYVVAVVQYLPTTYGDRFWFDAGLTRAMTDDWSVQKLFSPMIVPCYEKQWGYARFPMPLSEALPGSTEHRAHVVDLIFLPKGDDVGQITLLDYPWIAHELAHNLMFRFDNLLIPLIGAAVAAPVRQRRLAAIADRGRARAASQNALDEFSRFWMPTADHRNWAHELSADLIAAWVLGPVYLAVFEDLLGHADQNPYQVSMVHPPYAVRVKALLKIASRMHFVEHAQELQRISDSLGSSRWRSEKTNRYGFLADLEVIDGLIDGVFRFCGQLRLRQWDNSRLSTLRAAAISSTNHELGTDLLISAWLAFSHHGKENYARWESEVVRAIAEPLKP